MPSKLTEEQVREILRRVVNGRTLGKRRHPDNQSALTKEFGIAQSAISRIASRQLYRHVKV